MTDLAHVNIPEQPWWENALAKRAEKRRFDVRILLDQFPDDTTNAEIARQMNVRRETVWKWKSGQGVMINAYTADRYAVRLGTHPSLVWWEEWWKNEA